MPLRSSLPKRKPLDLSRNQPIQFEYSRPSENFIGSIRRYDAAVEIRGDSRILIENRYFKDGVKGSLSQVYIREFLLIRLNEALKALEPDYGFVIYDGYRSREAQAGLFESYFRQIKARYPDWTTEALHAETRKFVAHPDEPSRFEVPPHNSGGAIDLGLTYRGRPVNMGTDFDDLTSKAETDYFEKPWERDSGFSERAWEEVRDHRRMLFHALASAGFTNWKFEWWHFDIGNCVCAQVLGLSWIYESMDQKISLLK